MASVFKITVVQYWLRNVWIGPDGAPCPKDTPGAKFIQSRKVKAGTLGAVKVKKKSGRWYGRPAGRTSKPVSLSTNKTAAQQLLADLVKKAAENCRPATDPPSMCASSPHAYRRRSKAAGSTS